MSTELGATKITELMETTDNEDDQVVNNILNELEGTDNNGLIDDQLMDLSNNEQDMDDNYSDDGNDMNDNLFNTDNIIFNTSEVPDSSAQNSIKEPSKDVNDNTLMENVESDNNSGMDVTSFLSSDMQDILDLIKYPLIVVVIVLLINNEFVVKHLSQIKVFITDEKINMYGYVLQAILVGLILLSIMYIIKICTNSK
tara:strand:+ start:196 stop:789 length:594 start_codon:yes stop_codon:yes gene_type:complete